MNRFRLRLTVAAALGLLVATASQAQTGEPPAADSALDNSLPVVRTKAKRLGDEALPPERSITVVNETAIQRLQSENIFDVLKTVPGVGIAGGPRASGMRFTLRGFTDNEDVLFKIDGAVKGFEKYRFGGGVFLEPELLKALAVERGPSVTSGSGALGGTIEATTKSAADLLRPGQRIGALTKLGYNENNGERLRMVSVFGRPNDKIDLIAAIIRRDSHDIRLPDKTRLAQSATHSESQFVKLGVAPIDNLLIELSHLRYLSGPEATPYDATGGRAGVGGVVRRQIDDGTTNLRFTYDVTPDLKLRGTFAREKTHLHDRHVARESLICVNTLASTNARAIPYCDDFWEYDNTNAELFAEIKQHWGSVEGEFKLGAQALRNERQIRRISANETINAINWPNGFNADQPPGDKHSEALIADSRFTWGDWTLTPGVRWDRYTVIARGGTRDNMLREGQDPEISFSKAQPSIGLTWQIPRSDLSLTARYNEAFRPPLIDQYFRDGSGNSAGQSGLCMRSYGDPLSGNVVNSGTIQPLYDPAGLGLPYNAALDHAPLSGICGDLYRPQESVNKELTLTWSPAPGPTGNWHARLTTFRIHTSQLLTSLRWVNGHVAQPGVEKRRGTEFELRWANRDYFGDLAVSTVRRSARNEDALQSNSIESFSIPPDTATGTLGVNFLNGRVDAGWRVRHIADRQAYSGGAPAICIGGTLDAQSVGTHKGATLHDLFANWQINDWASARFGIDNLGNKDYCLSSSFAGSIGFHAPGRAAKMSVTLQF